jgi:hypothetical protein
MTSFMNCRIISCLNTHARKRECILIIGGLFTLLSNTVFFLMKLYFSQLQGMFSMFLLTNLLVHFVAFYKIIIYILF